MSPVAVVTDTTQYLPAEVVARHGLHLVSLYVTWNGRTDREADLGDFGAFYEHLRTDGPLPSTSQPSVGDFLAVYEPLLAEGRDVLSIHLSGGISGTVRAAEQARAVLLERGAEVFGRGPEFVSEIGPVIGTHTGPGLTGVAAVRRALLGPV